MKRSMGPGWRVLGVAALVFAGNRGRSRVVTRQ
jgi:hypothetical protein